MGVKILTIQEDILGANEAIAKRNQELLDKNSILTVNIMSSPGAGKTSLILQTISNLKGKANIAVIEGDIASSLDANMTENALNTLPLSDIDLLLIENVGNLICPAEFALGEHKKVMLLSLPEGDDKPHKYPLMFTEADVVLLNKIDLLPYVDFDIPTFNKTVTGLNPTVKIFPVSCKTGDGLEEWFSWLQAEITELKRQQSSTSAL